ncbi:DNase I-like protein [Pleurotus eryngii]|uniref:DNase I-like protein n=1 Tax=Pleurotus eryngii TaxID=5323 RepID=A0A9P6DF71_PLEER|nr:DNase I-like protein [Pleurotus eryngii]
MKGFSSTQNDGGPTAKWLRINQIMRENKFGIMILQETHMDEEREANIQNLFGRRLVIKASADPTSPRQRAGIAAVLNRGEFDAEHAKVEELVPGRAILVKATIHNGKALTILGVYAPNSTSENAKFWDKIRLSFIENPNEKRPDIMLGDFNVVEDAIDRQPAHMERNSATEALDKLKLELGLRDGWRTVYPDSVKFTFQQTRIGEGDMPAMSRIDRIYITNNQLRKARDWRIQPSGLNSADHWIISVQVSAEDAPEIGNGRWTIPERVLEDKRFLEKAKEIAKDWAKKNEHIGNERTEENNPQQTYICFKNELMRTARNRDKVLVPQIKRAMEQTQKELNGLAREEQTQETMKMIIEKTKALTIMERRRHQKARRKV